MSLALAGVRAALTPRWVSDDLWKRAGQIPAFDIDFTRQTITDRIAGITPTFTRPSSEKRLWNGAAFQTYAADVPGFELRNGIWEYVHEPAATNLALHSDTLSNAVFIKTSCTVSGTRFIPNNGIGAGSSQLHQDIAVSAGVQYTFSWLLKAAGMNTVRFQFGVRNPVFLGQSIGTINLTTGAITSQGSTGTPPSSTTLDVRFVGDGWWRVSFTGTTPATTTVFRGSIYGDSVGDGVSGVDARFYQLETGPVATSPIITTGSAVTRNADVMTITGAPAADLIARLGSSYWAYVEGVYNSASANAFVSADDNTNNERWRVGHNGISASQVVVFDNNTNVATVGSTAGQWPLGVYRKVVAAFSQDNFRTTQAGGSIVSDTSGGMPIVTQFKIGAAQALGATPSLAIRRIALFPGIPSDAILNAVVA